MRELCRYSGRAGEELCWTVTARERKSVREEEREKGKGGRVRDKEERWERDLER